MNELFIRFEINQLKDIVANLSLKINEMQSSLKEFEKQRVNPKLEEIHREIETIKTFFNIKNRI